MLKLGITGTIASGKSAVGKILTGLGVRVIDADVIAREVVAPHTDGARLLRKEYGDEYFLEGDVLDRKKLGAHVFSNAQALLRLNAINKPLIMGSIEKRLADLEADASCGVAAVDAALLIEYGMVAGFDEVWLVTATDEQRIARIVKRDGLTADEAERRIANQLPESKKRLYCHRVIDNSGDAEQTRSQVHEALKDALIGMNTGWRKPCERAKTKGE